MSGLLLPKARRLLFPGRPAPIEYRRPDKPRPVPKRLRCDNCGVVHETLERRHMDPLTLSETRCTVCWCKGAKVVSDAP